jgi:hypothetical protein
MLQTLSPSGIGPENMHMAMGRLLPLYYLLMAGTTSSRLPARNANVKTL